MKKRILYIQYTNPAAYPPLEHSSLILAKREWDVLFLGLRLDGVENLVIPDHSNILIKLLNSSSPGWQQKLHYLRYCLWVLFNTIRWSPKWIYSSDLLSCPVALLLTFIPGINVIYHEHDSPNNSSNSIFLYVCMIFRKILARRANICILPNEERAEKFLSETNVNKDKVFCVWNCPSKEEIISNYSLRNDKKLWLHYHGSIVPTQLPTTLLNALVKLPDYVNLRIVGYETIGHKGYVNSLKENADRLGIGSRVEILGIIYARDELLNLCAQSNIGLALFTKQTRQPMVGASNKPFEYLSCGLSLLVANLPDWEITFVKPGYAVSCDPDDPESIASAIRWFISNPEKMREMGDQGRKKNLEDWNYERQLEPVFKLLNS